MLQKFKNWDRTIAKNYPKIWVLGLHIYVPLILVTWLLFYGFGWLISTDPLPVSWTVREFSQQITLYSILPTIIIGILYFIRQIRFNALRVHHHLPFKNPYLHFASFLLICVLFTSIPQAGHFGLYHRMKTSMNEEIFKEDLIHLNAGIAHFYQSDFSQSVFVYVENEVVEQAVDVQVESAVEAAEIAAENYLDVVNDRARRGETIEKSTYRLNDTKDSLILYRSYINYYSNYYYDEYSQVVSGTGWDTISLAKAREEMQLFAKLSPTYKGELENVDLNTIIAEHIDHNLDQMSVEPEHRKNFNKFKDVSRFKEIVSTNAQTAFQQSPFKCTTWKFWKGYLFLALYLSVLMFILSSVKLVDFGWALLTGSLTAISYAIINGLSFMDFVRPDGFVEFFNLILLSIYVCIYLWIMFSKRIKNGVKKAFGIAFQFFIPHVIYAYFGLFDEIHDCPYPRMDYNIDPCEGYEYFGRESYYMVAMAVCLLAVAIGIWFFNRYYTRRYVYPDPSR